MPGEVRSFRIWLCWLLASFLVVVAAWGVPERKTGTSISEGMTTGANSRDADIVAVVASQRITRSELDSPVKARIFDLEKQIYNLRRQKLDQTILQIVLRKEAEKQGVPVQKVVDGILAGGVEVTGEEINAYYASNIHLFSDWKGTGEELEKKITDQLGKQKGYQKVVDYANSLGQAYGVKIFLDEPQAPSARVEIGNDPVIGPENARLTIVEFSDYRCSACRKTHETVKQVRGTYQDEVRWVFKDFPLAQSSAIAAEAARCANEQGKFQEYQDLLFSADGDLTRERLVSFAGQLGLKADAFNQCLESRRYRSEVEKNMEEGARVGVSMTPTYIINGKMFPGGPPLDEFKRLVSRELIKVEIKGQEGRNKSTM